MSSCASPFTARDATRSFSDVASLECTLEMSLLALFRRAFRTEVAETDVMLVAADMEAESLELAVVVGVLAYVVEDAEPRLGVKLDLALPEPVFLGAFSGRWA